jgi:hypothetical protein
LTLLRNGKGRRARFGSEWAASLTLLRIVKGRRARFGSTTTDGQIDCPVYALYGLTEEEIRIIEEATQK